ncbi:MAG: hypothetical protein KatS3mg103_0472 [Phycisphaerales bacterium]|nr:MAG: hypothetical protein KatS3mg103_0472 [Phycisphaerales bacterium]
MVLGDGRLAGARRYSIELLHDGAAAMDRAAGLVEAMGGTVELTVPEVGRLEATLTEGQLVSLVHDGDVLFVDRWMAPENDMNIARSIGGANYIEGLEGLVGQGVRAEVMDSGLRQNHQEFTHKPPLLHGSTGVDSHGTSTYSINFARGASSSARGMVPEAQGIFASYNFVSNRYSHTAQLVNPTLPYRAVYQSNSWGSGLTTSYTTTTTEMDRIIFDTNLLIVQSQSNNGDQLSRPQAWAKNIVSVGGVLHRDTLSKSDDCWCGGGQPGAGLGRADQARPDALLRQHLRGDEHLDDGLHAVRRDQRRHAHRGRALRAAVPDVGRGAAGQSDRRRRRVR